MAMRLQTAEGKIKKYKTTYCVGAVDGYCIKYRSNCGLEWNRGPEQHEECHHLECAISIVNADRKHGPLIFLFLMAISAMLFQNILCSNSLV